MMLGGLRNGISHASSQNYANCVKRLVIHSMGVPDPLDHVVFTVILRLAIYVPTKLLYHLLWICYGESAKKDEAVLA